MVEHLPSNPSAILARIVALADSDPFMCIGHIIEHVERRLQGRYGIYWYEYRATPNRGESR